MSSHIPDWLDWAQKLQAIAQTGLNYNPNGFDAARYQQILDIAAEMMAVGAGENIAVIRESFGAQAGHITPKIDVRGAVFHEGKLLLVQEMLDGGRWTLPGGWSDIGESAGENVAREIAEETGYRARPVKLLALYDRNKHPHPPFMYHAYKAFFLCDLVDTTRTPDPRNVETGDVGWFAEDEVAGLSLSMGRVTPGQIARFFAHLRDPNLPTDFD